MTDDRAIAPLGRWACDETSLAGFRCDMQPEHGGDMHSGLYPGVVGTARIWWWDKTGELTSYSRRAVERVR